MATSRFFRLLPWHFLLLFFSGWINRQQSRNVLDYLTILMQAHFARESAPSLLPGM
jgi:hypothetical protein